MRSAEEVASAYGLDPAPYEGWSQQTDHVPGRLRAVRHLFEAGQPAPWHRMPASVLWAYEAGGPCVLSRSADGRTADALHLGAGSGLAGWGLVPEGHYQTLEPLGAWSLIRATYVPDARLTDRLLTPDDWYPGNEEARS